MSGTIHSAQIQAESHPASRFVVRLLSTDMCMTGPVCCLEFGVPGCNLSQVYFALTFQSEGPIDVGLMLVVDALRFDAQYIVFDAIPDVSHSVPHSLPIILQSGSELTQEDATLESKLFEKYRLSRSRRRCLNDFHSRLHFVELPCSEGRRLRVLLSIAQCYGTGSRHRLPQLDSLQADLVI